MIYSCEPKPIPSKSNLMIRILIDEEVIKYYTVSQARITILRENDDFIVADELVTVSSTETLIQIRDVQPAQYTAALNISLTAKDEYSLPPSWKGTKNVTATINPGMSKVLNVYISKEDVGHKRQLHIEWQKCLGGTNEERASAIQQTTDGGFVIIGTTNSNDGNVTENHGDFDVWIVKLGTSGDIEWRKCVGGTSHEEGSSIQQTKDGGYIIAGRTISKNGDVSGNNGYYDVWVVKLK